MHPRLLMTAQPITGLRSRNDVLASIQGGHTKTLWDCMLKAAGDARVQPPYTPRTPLPERTSGQAEAGNADFHIVHAAGTRIQQAALITLLTGEQRFKDDALVQLECLFDDHQWPDWCDRSHPRPTDLRTGQFMRALGLAYDWMYTALSETQRKWFVENLDHRAIQPYLQALDQKAWWAFSKEPNNWMTCIVGGAGMAGMALGKDHPDSQRLVEEAVPRMLQYLDTLGPEGEFNECIGYSSAMRFPIEFFNVHRYWQGGGENLLASKLFRAFCDWYIHFMIPPGRQVPFGDTHHNREPYAAMFATMAAATREPRYQWFYEQYRDQGDRSDLCEELLNYDPTVPSGTPEGQMPGGRGFHAHGACWSSRTDWNPLSTACVVVGKGGHGSEMHGHHDAGTLCIDGFGKTLITEPGTPLPVYPPDFFGPERYAYYHASCIGHNVPMFGGREMRSGQHYAARILDMQFKDDAGAVWMVDTTALYGGIRRVRRGVIHLLPGIIAVLDACDLKTDEETSIRWHPAGPVKLDRSGRFILEQDGVHLEGYCRSLNQTRIRLRMRHHELRPPFNLDRLGNPLIQVNEPYLDVTLNTQTVRLVSLFSVSGRGIEPAPWRKDPSGWRLMTPTGGVRVTADDCRMTVSDDHHALSLDLDAGTCEIKPER